LQVGIVAVLARSADADSQAYLRKIWDESPERRQSAALGLAQQPGGENWIYLLRSLPILEPAAAREICRKLTEVEQAPEDADAYRQAILIGLKMRQKEPEKDDAADAALGLLYFWTGEELAAGEAEDKRLAAWQKWFAEKYPIAPEAKLPTAGENAKYAFEDLLEYLNGEEAAGSATKGEKLFVTAQCAKCHRHSGQGENFGPDLTTLANRFTKKEILESVIFPSHVISSQYQSKLIRTTDGRTLTGLLVPDGGGEVTVMQPSGEKVTVLTDDIEEEKPSKLSSMPTGLLDPLTLEEIADLFAYLQKPEKAPVISRRPGENATK
jgi:putative heme-binding domain-containing protein